VNRRGFLSSCLALAVAPAIVRADSLMRVVPRNLSIVLAGDPIETFEDADGIATTADGESWICFVHPDLERDLRGMMGETHWQPNPAGQSLRYRGVTFIQSPNGLTPKAFVDAARKPAKKNRVYGPRGAEAWRR
jgi:hypothetical protein